MKLKKRTYIIDKQANKDFYELHSLLKTMPLTIAYLNGMIIPKHGMGRPTIQFPNPYAAEMMFQLYNLPSSHTRFSATIVEYYNKKNQTIAFLFPDASVYYTGIKTNNSIRRSLAYEIKMRKDSLSR